MMRPMSASAENGKRKEKTPENCLVHTVADLLKTESSLEAVTLNRKQEAVSVAFLGDEKKDPDLGKRVADKIQEVKKSGSSHCGLLEGDTDCHTCSIPFAPFERQSFQVRHEHDATTISRVTCPTAPRFWHWREIPWPKFGPREVEIHDDHDHGDEWKPQLIFAALCGVFGLAGYFLRTHGVSLPLFILSYLFGAWFATKEVWELLQKRKLDIHFLMLAVAFGSASIQAWGEGATLLFLFSFSGALEHYAMGRTQREINSLFKAAPKVAILLDGQGIETEILLEEIRPGMRLLIKPDTQFPVDGEISKGQTASDESNLTGEATPVEKNIGDNVLAGTLNLWGAVELTVLRPANESALQKIIRLIHDSQHLKAPTQRFTDKFGSTYTYGILGLSFVMFLIWWLGFGLSAFTTTVSQKSAFYRAMTLLVVASPCALVLSIPSAVLAAIAAGARRGVLFRGGAAVEKLAEIKVVALDKTGTLTTGELRIESVESFPAGRETEVAQLAYSLERLSNHPLARAVTRYGKQQKLEPVALTEFESVAGSGLQAKYNGKIVLLGKREWIATKTASEFLQKESSSGSGLSEVWLAYDGLIGKVLLRDDIRPQAASVIRQLRDAGLKTIVLTGDRKSSAEDLKARLNLDDVRAELKPEQKVAAIREFIEKKELVAMVGDGVNDAPSLAAAHVGVAMGARGSDAALEQAEVVLMNDRLENFWQAFQLSQRARRIIQQNLFVSLGTVVVLVGFALFGAIPLTLGVLGHEGSTVVVVLNSLRLLFQKSEE